MKCVPLGLIFEAASNINKDFNSIKMKVAVKSNISFLTANQSSFLSLNICTPILVIGKKKKSTPILKATCISINSKWLFLEIKKWCFLKLIFVLRKTKLLKILNEFSIGYLKTILKIIL